MAIRWTSRWTSRWTTRWTTRHSITIVLIAIAGWHLGSAALIQAKTLAFGPGHRFGTALPGRAGNSVIAGHRDTHFAFLRDLRIGEFLDVEAAGGIRRRYRIVRAEVMHKSNVDVLAPEGPTRLTLITCFPFDAIVPGGPLRYVVVAEAVTESLIRPFDTG